MEDFRKLKSKIDLSPLDSNKLTQIASVLGLSFSPNIPSLKFMEILDTKITQTLRRLFEGTATLERSNKETIVEVCREYNNQIEELCQSMGYKISKTISDLYNASFILTPL